MIAHAAEKENILKFWDELKMQKYGGAVIHMKNIKLNYLVGGPIENVRPLPPYHENVCEFLAELSRSLQRDKRAKAYPDILSFAFFFRKGNIAKLAGQHKDGKNWMGRGLAFHIAPSNVPVNCAFTYAFGLLSGNANVIRVSSKDFEQVHIICDVIKQLFQTGMYETVRKMTAFVSYEKSKEINDQLSQLANVRIIWGGDETIKQIRKSPMSSRCVELTFADRYSFAIMDPVKISEETDLEVKRLAEQFYNDTYLMDQNACSTPHLVVWINGKSKKADIGKKRFWNALAKTAMKYDLADIKVSDKYVMLCKYMIDLDCIKSVDQYDNLLYIITLNKLRGDITDLRGKFGLFFQHDISDLEKISDFITNKVQTCTYYGVEKESIIQLINNYSLMGIDRIVPIGSALDIGVFWDGYDIIKQMDRVII